MSSFTLNKDIFNPELYKSIQDVWFKGYSLDSQGLPMDVAKRWFMLQGQDRDIFDSVCRSKFEHALEAIGPEQMSSLTVEPFLQEIQDAVQKDPTDQGSRAAWTALSFVILLDQMPRNIYRTNKGLRKVYNHYDKISFALADTLLSNNTPIVRPDLHPQWHNTIGYRYWFYMPLMHSEELSSHKRAMALLEKLQEDVKKVNASDEVMFFSNQGLKSEKEHMEIIEKFGRYPHRNGALDRESTEEEKKFMAEGGATFGVAQDDK